MPNDSATVIVKSPIRFVVVVPGDPEPRVVTSSSDEYADLVGAYSLREMGLDFLTVKRQRSEVLTGTVWASGQALEQWNSVDIWATAPSRSDRRSRETALIVQGPPLLLIRPSLREKVQAALKTLLVEMEDAVRREDAARIKYLGGVMAASIAEIKEEIIARIRSQRAGIRMVIAFYGLTLLVAATALALQYFLPTLLSR